MFRSHPEVTHDTAIGWALPYDAAMVQLVRCRRLPLGSLVLAIALLALAAARAGEETTRIPLPHPVSDETDWYGVYQGREKVGWALFALERTDEGGDVGEVYVSRSRIEATLTRLGRRIEFSFDATDVFRGTPPFDLLRSREIRNDGSGERSMVLDRYGEGYVATVTVGDVTEIHRFEDFDYTLADRLCHVHWTMTWPAKGDMLRVREFDIAELRPDVYTYAVKAVGERPANGIRITTFDVGMRSAANGPLGRAVLDTDGRMLKGPLAGVAEMRLESPEQAVERRLASDLLAFGHAPTTEHLGDPRTVRRLVVAVYGRGADRWRDGPRQRVRRDSGTGDVLIMTGADTDGPDQATKEEIASALEATVTFPATHPRVQVLAAKAVEGVETRAEQVARLASFVSGFLENVNLPGPVSVDRLLEDQEGDSTEHARLFVTLARSLGIPAREVFGLVYLGDDVTAFGGHAWCEVVVDGRWVPVDPTWNQTTPDATHLAYARGGGDWVKMLAVTDGLSFEIREVVKH